MLKKGVHGGMVFPFEVWLVLDWEPDGQRERISGFGKKKREKKKFQTPSHTPYFAHN